MESDHVAWLHKCEYVIAAETVRDLYGDWLDKQDGEGVE